MVKGKKVREKGKTKLSRYFKKIDEGSSVGIVVDKSIVGSFPKRIRGRSGKVVGSRGEYKVVQLNAGSKVKKYIIHPVHLKELK